MLYQLKEKYGLLFHVPALESQLLFMYRDTDFHEKKSMQNKVNGVIAISSAPVERSFSCLKSRNILKRCRGPRVVELPLKDVHPQGHSSKLHDLVIKKFSEKPRLELLYKLSYCFIYNYICVWEYTEMVAHHHYCRLFLFLQFLLHHHSNIINKYKRIVT